MIENKSHQISLTRLRISNHRLQVEQGRYTRPPTARELRLCPICNLGEVEDEEHFLTRCTALSDERRILVNEITPPETLTPTTATPELYIFVIFHDFLFGNKSYANTVFIMRATIVYILHLSRNSLHMLITL